LLPWSDLLIGFCFGLETLNKDPTIPREAIVSMVRLMADLGLVDRSAATNTAPKRSTTTALPMNYGGQDFWRNYGNSDRCTVGSNVKTKDLTA